MSLLSRSKKSNAERTPSKPHDRDTFELGSIEQLESRLCLGGLASPQVGEVPGEITEDVTVAHEVASAAAAVSATKLSESIKVEDQPAETKPEKVAQTGEVSKSETPDLEQPTENAEEGESEEQRDVTDELPEDVLASALAETEATDGLLDEFESELSEKQLDPVLEDSEDGSNDETESKGSFNIPITAGQGGSPVQGDSHQSDGQTSTSLGAEGNLSTTSNEVVDPYAGLSAQEATRAKLSNTEGFAFSGPANETRVIGFDFRDLNGFTNEITPAQQVVAIEAMNAWTEVTGGKVVFEQDTQAPIDEIVNIGTGSLAAFEYGDGVAGLLAVGGGQLTETTDGETAIAGVAWMDSAENWDTVIGNGDQVGSFDYYSVVAHELGHAFGLEDSEFLVGGAEIMKGTYHGEVTEFAIADANLGEAILEEGVMQLRAMTAESQAQLDATEIAPILDRAAIATPSEDAIIAIVDRMGRILGVRVEQGVIDAIDNNPDLLAASTDRNTSGGVQGNGTIDPGPEQETLIYAIDGAVAKARTASFFANGTPDSGNATPLTTRTVRFISQSTITEREVNGNPSIIDPDATNRGPGVVAPVGLGGHFPPETMFTPHVDLYAIEKTNRDSLIHPGDDAIKGTADDIPLRARFNIDPNFIAPLVETDPASGLPVLDGGGMPIPNPTTRLLTELEPPESYGVTSGLAPNASARGLATMPGGIPLFRDTNGDQFGDTMVAGIGVFFPGPNGFASYEQQFNPDTGLLRPFNTLTPEARLNSPLALEAEFIGVVAAGGSLGAEIAGAPGANVPNTIDGGFDIPFGTLSLVGINLEVIGDIPGILGVQRLVDRFRPTVLTGANTGVNMDLGGVTARSGNGIAEGWLVTPHDSRLDLDNNGQPDITAAQVEEIILRGVAQANRVRAAVRLPLNSATKMVLSVTDTSGEVLGTFRMPDATIFSIDVSITKARNATYYADDNPANDPNNPGIQDDDIVQNLPRGTAFTARTFRYLVEPRFPSGQEAGVIGAFSPLTTTEDINGDGILQAAEDTNNSGTLDFVDPTTGLTVGTPLAASAFDSTVGGFDTFRPGTNFRDPGDSGGNTLDGMPPVLDANGANAPKANQSGIVFFPGSTPIYDADGNLIGGFGVSGDGVDQDDVVTAAGAGQFLPKANNLRADQVHVQTPDGAVRLPFMKFLRNPEGRS